MGEKMRPERSPHHEGAWSARVKSLEINRKWGGATRTPERRRIHFHNSIIDYPASIVCPQAASLILALGWRVIAAIGSRSMERGISDRTARADALLGLAQAQGAASPPYMPASWVSNAGDQAILLVIVLLVAASGFAYAGQRLRAPLRVVPPVGVAAGFMIAI
jgi:hypothetical protein